MATTLKGTTKLTRLDKQRRQVRGTRAEHDHYTALFYDELMRLYNKGWSGPWLAAALDCTPQSVYYHINKAKALIDG